ncbi:MAG: hypothetical protein A3F72_02500 [Bacteroidetes bacterium RIFCSPLOWO2_12_FULL_35_15]|nr:MAG: hypothetical protein A3F72_02500 [Bacteroidetes bacterium RIFCSPLOWO2_12_FULL_35_15]
MGITDISLNRINSSFKSSLEDIKNRLKNHKTLLITDTEISGCHISFSLNQNKIKYTIDKGAIEKGGFKV